MAVSLDFAGSGSSAISAILKGALRGEMLEIPADKMLKPDDVFDFGPGRRAAAELTKAGWRPTP